MENYGWNKYGWGKSGPGPVPEPSDVEVLNIQNVPISVVSPAVHTVEVASLPIPYSAAELINKRLIIEATFSAVSTLTPATNCSIYIFVKDASAPINENTTPFTAAVITSTVLSRTWNMRGAVAFRGDGTYIASTPRWAMSSYVGASGVNLSSFSSPTENPFYVGFSVSASDVPGNTVITLEHSAVYLEGK